MFHVNNVKMMYIPNEKITIQNHHEMQLVALSQAQLNQLKSSIPSFTCVELPEMLSIETRLITKEISGKRKLRNVRHIDDIKIGKVSPPPTIIGSEILVTTKENAVTDIRKITTPSTIKIVPISTLLDTNNLNKISQATATSTQIWNTNNIQTNQPPKIIVLDKPMDITQSISPQNWKIIPIGERNVSNLVIEHPEYIADSTSSNSQMKKKLSNSETMQMKSSKVTKPKIIQVSYPNMANATKLSLKKTQKIPNRLVFNDQITKNIIPKVIKENPIIDLTSDNTLKGYRTMYNNVPIKITTKPSYKDVGIETDAPPPTRHREIQTNFTEKTAKEVGIQCTIDDEFDHNFIDEISQENENDDDNDKMNQLLEFINKNSIQHNSDICECLKCGNISKTYTDMVEHMAAHFELPVLCSECGKYFKHEIYYKNHDCRLGNERNVGTVGKKYKCPHFLCPCVATSLFELTEHINEEHIKGDGIYHCRNCKKRFHTLQELSRHFPLSLECLIFTQKTIANLRRKYTIRYRKRLKLLESRRLCALAKKRLSTCNNEKSKIGYRCTICYKYCSHEYIFKKHYCRCLKLYQKRMIDAQNTTILNNKKVENIEDTKDDADDEFIGEESTIQNDARKVVESTTTRNISPSHTTEDVKSTTTANTNPTNVAESATSHTHTNVDMKDVESVGTINSNHTNTTENVKDAESAATTNIDYTDTTECVKVFESAAAANTNYTSTTENVKDPELEQLPIQAKQK